MGMLAQPFLLLPAFGTLAAALVNPQTQRALKLMTYNIHAWRDASHRCNFDRIVQVVKAAQPDILCLNEVLHPFARPPSTSSSRATEDIIEDYYRQVKNNQGRDNPVAPSLLVPSHDDNSFLNRLAEATGLKNVDFVAATDNSYFGQGVSFGNAILTCHPIVKTCHIVMEVAEGDVDLGQQKRDFVDPRSCGAAVVNLSLSGDEHHCLGVAYAHLDHKSEELREKQIKAALQKLKIFLDDIPQIICGDFNTFQKSDCNRSAWQAILNLYDSRGWPEPPERSLVLGALADEGYLDTFYESAKDDEGNSGALFPDPTSWSNKPLMRIDHIYHKASGKNVVTNLIPKRHHSIDTDASDHFPVILEATLV